MKKKKKKPKPPTIDMLIAWQVAANMKEVLEPLRKEIEGFIRDDKETQKKLTQIWKELDAKIDLIKRIDQDSRLRDIHAKVNSLSARLRVQESDDLGPGPIRKEPR